MPPRKGKPSSSTAHLVCDCGHEKMVHGTGLIKFGSDDLACALTYCDCPEFLEEPRERLPRAKTVKTLDLHEPKLFKVAQ